jgi:mxaK protein
VVLKPRLHKWLRFIAIALLALILWDSYRWWDARRTNRAIADGSIVSYSGDLPAPALFAQAYLHAQKGDRERAIALYKSIEASSNIELAHAARYNRANGYLMKAMELAATENPNSGIPLAELAKDTYRALLRSHPGDWDTKYNLERALRLVPDPDDSDDVDLPPPQQSERAPTTMRGFTLGLP